ncbi:GNAT family N-acetyltransferase [Cytobacillus sp. FJAT-54145]|uniref:GNAT family N-acetyltransferase n=1 Tax=Cytobacillus spartinae TaxID=3299023 RepID=A0ABW6KBY8_9BACI
MLTNKLLSSKNIKLSHFSQEDLDTIQSWYGNEQTMRHFDAIPMKPKTEEEIKNWLSSTSKDTYRFAIRLNGTNELIGLAELDGILWSHRTSWVSILIGNEGHWGKGYGKEAMRCIINYAFNELNLFRLQLTVFSYNERAIPLYENLGFKKEGSYRQFLERDGVRYDMHLYGLLRTEWK